MKKVFLTGFFEKKYLLRINWFNLVKFSEKLKTFNFINLKHPYLKFKFNIFWVAYRWVVLVSKSWNLIPLILCQKKDKNCWENLIWGKFEKQILENQKKALLDLEEGNFKVS